MKPVEELLSHLLREGVTEVAMVAGRLPCANVDGKFEPIDKAPPSNDELLALLHASGGTSHLETIAERPAQWSFRVNGVGMVGVAAVERGGKIQCRMSLMKRDAPKRSESLGRVVPPSLPKEEPKRPPPLSPSKPLAASIPVTGVDPFAAEKPSPREPMQAAKARRAPVAIPSHLKGITPLLEIALDSRARDIHIIAARPLLVRVSSDLVSKSEVLPGEEVERIAHALVPERLAATLEAEGSCDFAMDHPEFGRFRVNVSRQRTGMKISMRVIPREVPTLASLGLPSSLGLATHHHQGLVVITGPTGHGKTTTMAALVDLINSETSKHVITVEDPVEFMHTPKKAVLSQREVGSHTKTFASALKASLREDPDVIVVGELRDRETVHMAVSASETGHLVIGTMNTPSAAKTIDRLIDLFPPADQAQVRMTLAGGLRMIVSQRLVPNEDKTKLHPAVEVLPGSVALYTLIRDNRTVQIPSLQQRSKSSGSVLLDESLGELVKAGKTSLEIAKDYADSPAELENYVKGRAKSALGVAVDLKPGEGLLGGLFKKKGS